MAISHLAMVSYCKFTPILYDFHNATQLIDMDHPIGFLKNENENRTEILIVKATLPLLLLLLLLFTGSAH